MNYYKIDIVHKFIDSTEHLGALYKWWLEFPGLIQASDARFIEHCENVGMQHVVEHATANNNVSDTLENIAETLGHNLGRWTFFIMQNADFLFVFEENDVAMLFKLSV